jgi:hypothetical protein
LFDVACDFFFDLVIEDVKRSTKMLSVIILLVLITVSGIFVYLLFNPPCCLPDGDGGEFGDEYLTGTYNVDAIALTNEGTRVGSGIHPLADPPSTAFQDDFEGTSPWTSNDDVNEDCTSVKHWDNESARFIRAVDGNAFLSVDITINVGIDETVESYFYVNVTNDWDGGDYGKGDMDYFVFKVNFDDGNTLVYEVYGTYGSPSPTESVIDVSTQVTLKGIWCGINVDNIDADYLVQFGGPTPALPIPDITGFMFELDSTEANEEVYLDDVNVIIEPKPYIDGSYWKLVDTGDRVTSYVVDVNYSVILDDINDDTVYVQVSLWMEVYNGSTDISDLVITKTLIQKQLFLLLASQTTPLGDPAIINSWSSKVFSLPADGEVLGNDLYYAFYIMMETWGEMISSPGDYVYASDDYSGGSIDTLHFQWIVVDANIEIIVYAVGGAAGASGVLGIIGVVKKKRTRKEVAVTGKESLFN